jgi:hypothetical protein
VVEYYNWNHYGGGTAGTFEAILFENGSIQMQFLDGGSETGSGSTTGIEGNNQPSDHGLTYACNTANSLPDGLALCYVYPDSSGCVAGDVPWLGELPTSGTVPAQGTLDVAVFFTATASVGVTQTGDYYATLVVNGSPKVRVPVTMTVIDQAISPTAAFVSSARPAMGLPSSSPTPPTSARPGRPVPLGVGRRHHQHAQGPHPPLRRPRHLHGDAGAVQPGRV